MTSAIVDLGTNTFHLLIFENGQVLYRDSIAAKLGMGGISKGLIAPEAIVRGVEVLKQFRAKLDAFKVPEERVFAYGTSALRSASNQAEVLGRFQSEAGITVKVIDGETEAALIYEGVRGAVEVKGPTLIVDIGGGSVECIICNEEKVLWMRSFEIGGQRLMERFMKVDPLPVVEIERMMHYFREILLPLTNAVHQYQPRTLVGSSGSFETLNDMYYCRTTGNLPPQDTGGFSYPVEEYKRAYDALVFQSREERRKIPGMKDLRVDMIVVAMVLIRFLVETYQISEMRVSYYSLKEGAMSHA